MNTAGEVQDGQREPVNLRYRTFPRLYRDGTLQAFHALVRGVDADAGLPVVSNNVLLDEGWLGPLRTSEHDLHVLKDRSLMRAGDAGYGTAEIDRMRILASHLLGDDIGRFIDMEMHGRSSEPYGARSSLTLYFLPHAFLYLNNARHFDLLDPGAKGLASMVDEHVVAVVQDGLTAHERLRVQAAVSAIVTSRLDTLTHQKRLAEFGSLDLPQLSFTFRPTA